MRPEQHKNIPRNPDFIHHNKQTPSSASIREAVFGLEDGMVSTLGSITGIAAATGDPFTIFLAGFVIISVESISMGVGSYLSSKSEREIDERKLEEEKIELKKYPEEERQELQDMYEADGWSRELAERMAGEAAKNKQLFLQEMAYRELKVFPNELAKPGANGIIMGIAYIIGGFVPLLSYFFLAPRMAIPASIISTLFALFLLGAGTTKFSKRNWMRAGLEMFAAAGLAAAVGFAVGKFIEVVL